jgi:COP9 signalosome complex subunit 6
MQVDGQETAVIEFRELPFSIDTDETEMIAIDYVAKGAGSAAAVDDAVSPQPVKLVEAPVPDKKGKKRADLNLQAAEAQISNEEKEPVKPLTPEEEDQIASIRTRLNSVKMLQSRLALLQRFLQSLPPSYLSTPDARNTPAASTFVDPLHLLHLRNVQALLTRLSLLTPPSNPSPTDQAHSLASTSLAQANDVSLASLLSLLGQDVQSLSELGRKFYTVESAKSNSKSKPLPKGPGGMGGAPGSFSGLGDSDDRFSGTVTGSFNTVGATV